MKKIVLLLGLAFGLAAMQTGFADDGSNVVSCKRSCKRVTACKACGKKPCCCDQSDGQGWNYKQFRKH